MENAKTTQLIELMNYINKNKLYEQLWLYELAYNELKKRQPKMSILYKHTLEILKYRKYRDV